MFAISYQIINDLINMISPLFSYQKSAAHQPNNPKKRQVQYKNSKCRDREQWAQKDGVKNKKLMIANAPDIPAEYNNRSPSM